MLTPIAGDLHVTQGKAGQGIAISGAFAGITSLFVSALAGSMNRKTLLPALTGAMGLSGAIVALAPSYFVYMVGRLRTNRKGFQSSKEVVQGWSAGRIRSGGRHYCVLRALGKSGDSLR